MGNKRKRGRREERPANATATTASDTLTSTLDATSLTAPSPSTGLEKASSPSGTQRRLPAEAPGAGPQQQQQQQQNVPRKRQKRDEYRARTGTGQSSTAGRDDGGKEDTLMPKKKFYRQRAHANPFSDHKLAYPASPDEMDWSPHFPAYMVDAEAGEGSAGATTQRRLRQPIEVADVGCGFGGLLFALAREMPRTLMLGLEIRVSVTEFVQSKIAALRAQHPHPPLTSPATTASQSSTEAGLQGAQPGSAQPGLYQNISALRANTMKFLPNLLPKHSLAHLFLCFPDPHFKARKHKARIVSATLASEYAYVLQPGRGRVYTITDVEDLHDWMVARFAAHPSFARLPEEERDPDCEPAPESRGSGEGEGRRKSETQGEHEHEHEHERLPGAESGPPQPKPRPTQNPLVRIMRSETEEGKKVARNGGSKFVSVWLRTEDPPWPGDQ